MDMAPTTKAQQKAVAKYMKNNYDSVLVRIPKGCKAMVQAAAEQKGVSINGYVNRAILAQLGREEWPEQRQDGE